ncbi:hypothetical protein SAMN05421755_100510 [Nitrosomonas sp. Nm33]|nr:hypothetical protein SAMN05421755_100510 [Nitrosomonas sp. Nm33]
MECVVLRVQGKAQRCGMVAPFQGVATQPCACKIAQSVPKRKHPEGENEIYRNGYYIHNVNIKMSDQPRNLGSMREYFFSFLREGGSYVISPIPYQ